MALVAAPSTAAGVCAAFKGHSQSAALDARFPERHPLPEQLQGKLELSGWTHRCDLSEVRIRHRAVGIQKLCMIERVERICPELQVHRLAQRNKLSGPYVIIVDSRTGDDIRSGVPEEIGRGCRETGSIEPVVAITTDVLVRQTGPSVACLVGAKLRHRVHGRTARG